MTQLLASDVAFGSDRLNAAAEEIMLSCLKPLGAWYAENEVEGGAYQRDMMAKALANGLALCDGAYKGERNEVEVRVSLSVEAPYQLSLRSPSRGRCQITFSTITLSSCAGGRQ